VENRIVLIETGMKADLGRRQPGMSRRRRLIRRCQALGAALGGGVTLVVSVIVPILTVASGSKGQADDFWLSTYMYLTTPTAAICDALHIYRGYASVIPFAIAVNSCIGLAAATLVGCLATAALRKQPE
jgi:hypothetical protein